MDLVQYLESLNCDNTSQSVYVNPEDVNQFRIGQDCFENGGLPDGWVNVGSLKDLSFAFQSTSEAFASVVSGGLAGTIRDRNYTIDGYCFPTARYTSTITCNMKGLYNAYTDGRLDEKFEAWLEGQMEEVKDVWAHEAAWDFVCNRIPEILENIEAYAA